MHCMGVGAGRTGELPQVLFHWLIFAANRRLELNSLRACGQTALELARDVYDVNQVIYSIFSA